MVIVYFHSGLVVQVDGFEPSGSFDYGFTVRSRPLRVYTYLINSLIHIRITPIGSKHERTHALYQLYNNFRYCLPPTISFRIYLIIANYLLVYSLFPSWFSIALPSVPSGFLIKPTKVMIEKATVESCPPISVA